MEWLQDNIIYTTIHGSQCYGLANNLSDLDIKGIVVPPKEVEYNLFHKFEQAENHPYIESLYDELRNPLNPKVESTTYSIRKFFVLAAEVNPNIIEILYTDEKHHMVRHPIMETLMYNRDLFLSAKARWTFAGYAAAQLKKIERHHKWIVLGEVKKPSREEFGLPTTSPKGLDELHGYIKSKVEQWNLNQFPLEEIERSNLKETIWELITEMTGKEISLANWPDRYAEGVIFKLKRDFNLKDELVDYILSERNYVKATRTYESWVAWKTERNPERRKLEENCGYDSKHGSHLIRLLRMGHEILSEGKVIVNRTGIDADELLDIKNGAWSYDKVMEYKEEMDSKLEAEYIRQKKLIAEGLSTPLPQSVNKEKLNTLYHELYEKYWSGK